MTKLILYTRPGCHLCEEMKEKLSRALQRVAFEVQEIDVDQDPELRKRYGESIPVLAVNCKVVFKGGMALDPFFEKFWRVLEQN